MQEHTSWNYSIASNYLIATVVVAEVLAGSIFGMLFINTLIGTDPPVCASAGIRIFSCHTPTRTGARPEYRIFASGTNVFDDPISTCGFTGPGVAAVGADPSGGAFATGPSPVPYRIRI